MAQEAITLDAQAEIGLLVRELSAVANKNPRFRSGESDYVYFEVTEGDQVIPASSLEETEESDEDYEIEDDEDETLLVPGNEISYKFEAERRRYVEPDDNGKITERGWVSFVFSMIGRQHNILLPPHIAEKISAYPGEEASRELGSMVLRREQQFTVSTHERTFAVCESISFLDADNEEVTSACSCTTPGIMYVPDYHVDTSGDVTTVEMDYEHIEQRLAYDLQARHSNEVIELKDAAQALAEWCSYADAEADIETAARLGSVRAARHVLRNARIALLDQAGVTLPRSARAALLRVGNTALVK